MTQQVSIIQVHILIYEMIYDLSINHWDPCCCICSPHFDSSSGSHPVATAKSAEAVHKKKRQWISFPVCHCYSFNAIGDVAYSFVVCSTAGLRTWMVTRIWMLVSTICRPKSKALLRHPTERLQEPGNMENSAVSMLTSKNRSSIPNPRVDCVSISIQSQNLTDAN